MRTDQALRHEPERQRSKHVATGREDVRKLNAQAGNQAVGALLGSGAPLAPDVRTEMERRFGTNFADVRVHDDASAHDSAAALEAKAYSHGSDIAFGEGRFVPGTREGKQLLAHELAHVVQQRRGGIPPEISPAATHEQHAAQAAQQVAMGASVVAVGGATGVGVARNDDAQRERKRDRERKEGKEARADKEHEGDRDKRQRDKARTEERNRARQQALGGQNVTPARRAQNEVDRMMAEARTGKLAAVSKDEKLSRLRRFKLVLKDLDLPQVRKNYLQGQYDELLRTPKSDILGAPQTKSVAGGAALHPEHLQAGRDPYAQPDFSKNVRADDGQKERGHVNLKSDNLDITPARARAKGKAYRDQAIRNMRHLPDKPMRQVGGIWIADPEPIVLDFAEPGTEAVRTEILKQVFAKGSPVKEVRFHTLTVRRDEWEANEAQIAQANAAEKKPPAPRKATGKKSSTTGAGADTKASLKKTAGGKKTKGTTAPAHKPPTASPAQKDAKRGKTSNATRPVDKAPKKAEAKTLKLKAPKNPIADKPKTSKDKGQDKRPKKASGKQKGPDQSKSTTKGTPPPNPAKLEHDTAPPATQKIPAKSAHVETKAPTPQHADTVHGTAQAHETAVVTSNPKSGSIHPTSDPHLAAPAAGHAASTHPTASHEGTTPSHEAMTARPLFSQRSGPATAVGAWRGRIRAGVSFAAHTAAGAAFDFIQDYFKEKYDQKTFDKGMERIAPLIQSGLGAQFDDAMKLMVSHPDKTVYGQVHFSSSVVHNTVQGPVEIGQIDEYSPPIVEFESVQGVTLTPVEDEKEERKNNYWIVSDTTTTHATYSVPYETPPFEELADYAVRKHMPLAPLRSYAEAQLEDIRTWQKVAEANPAQYELAVEIGVAPDHLHAQSLYWSQKLAELSCYDWD